MEKEFSDVELADAQYETSLRFIDSTSTFNFVSSIFLMCLYIALHLYSYSRISDSIAVKTDIFNINPSVGKDVLDLDLSLSHILANHRFIIINCTMVKDKKSLVDETLEYTITSEASIFNQNSQKTTETNKEKKTLRFTEVSEPINVLSKQVNDIKSIKLTYTIEGNLEKLSSLQFISYFYNSNSEKYSNSYGLLMTFLTGYMFIVYLMSYKFSIQSRILCFAVGLSAIFSVNPFKYFASMSISNITDHVLMGAFLSLFRMFLLFEVLSTAFKSVGNVLKIVIGIVFIFYATIQCAASYDRASVLQSPNFLIQILPTEQFLIYFDAIYFIAIVVFLVITAVKDNGQNSRPLIFYAIVIIIIFIVSMYSDVYYVLTGKQMYSNNQQSLRNFIYLTCSAFTLFMLHHSNNKDYKEFGDNKDDEGPMVLDVMQMDNDSDEEEEEDEK
ncbi:hypothetical protein GPJ56_009805 [Histomonas meleagridis]|uniref:uncharacterized protein n=1 Tax=Histomonas meleagridis TaxID=135588 RepID=UPI00355A5744|nr:hypothetical protein GPJ56_009805 [Histomonas meleagridis]KAH0802889.1 hypothetical protein GO595_004396 [Histomonas meleagridis]